MERDGGDPRERWRDPDREGGPEEGWRDLSNMEGQQGRIGQPQGGMEGPGEGWGDPREK